MKWGFDAMSVWTYVNIKFTVRKFMSVSDIEECFGYIDTWNHYKAFEPRNKKEIEERKSTDGKPIRFLPSGSEGSLDIFVEKTTKNKTVFHILGGLRDHYNTEDISSWFNCIIKEDENRDTGMIVKACGYARCDMDNEPALFNYSEDIRCRFDYIVEEIRWKIHKIMSDVEYFFMIRIRKINVGRKK